jgi:tetratricopeptide (TPR) repeat protein
LTKALTLTLANPQLLLSANLNALWVQLACARYFLKGCLWHSLAAYCILCGIPIRDVDRAIELNPKLAEAYAIRGAAYSKLDNYHQAINNYKIAAKLGYQPAQDFLRKQGINW